MRLTACRALRFSPSGRRAVLHYVLLSVLLMAPQLQARQTTLPPSVALRTEVSYVNIALLEAIVPAQSAAAMLSFRLIRDLHNSAEPVTRIAVSSALADSLETGVEYIIAYETVRKVRDNESKRYLALPEGPQLMQVQGAYPAIFRRHAALVERLTNSPQLAQTDPDGLIKSIFAGMREDDPAIKSFFVREIVNWNALYPHLSTRHYDDLYAALISANANPGTRTAILELREPLHTGIGVARIGAQARNLLLQMPVDLDPVSQQPTLVLNALLFMQTYQLADWDSVSRWTRATVPTIAERAVLILNAMDSERARLLARQRLSESLLPGAARRVLLRFVKN